MPTELARHDPPAGRMKSVDFYLLGGEVPVFSARISVPRLFSPINVGERSLSHLERIKTHANGVSTFTPRFVRFPVLLW